MVIDPGKFDQTSPKDLLSSVAGIREKKGKGKREFELLEDLRQKALDYFLNLCFEKALFYQHGVMEERSKPKEKRNQKIITSSLKGMEGIINEAEKVIEAQKADRWRSRRYRFQGRLLDYQGKYNKAVDYYKQAVQFATKDPEYTEKKIPRQLEYEAFLAYSLLMSGKDKEGVKYSRLVWKKFFDSSDGKRLKNLSYATWAIWATGIPIRVGQAWGKVKGMEKKELKKWLDEALKLIAKPVLEDPLIGKVDFAFRKDEIRALERELKL
jgi:tetratricopeptide (TPR) repeat protein